MLTTKNQGNDKKSREARRETRKTCRRKKGCDKERKLRRDFEINKR